MQDFIKQATAEAKIFMQRMPEQLDHYYLMIWDDTRHKIHNGGLIGGIPIGEHVSVSICSPARETLAHGYKLAAQSGTVRVMLIGTSLPSATNPDCTPCMKIEGPPQPNTKIKTKVGNNLTYTSFGFGT